VKSEVEACIGQGLCCTVPESDTLSPDPNASAVWEPSTTVLVLHTKPTSLRSESGRRSNARGTPSKEGA